MSEAGKGVLAMVFAGLIWGAAPLFYKLLVHISPVEILAHRTIWSFVFFAIVLSMQGRLSALWAAISNRSDLAFISLAALMISLNWFVFISAIQWNMAIEGALGYYIFPLVAVMLGRLMLGERLTRAQWGAVALASLAVCVLSVGLGVTPWIALMLSFSFGFYGVIKKRISVGPVVSVTAEVFVLLPVAALVLGAIEMQGGIVFGRDMGDSLLLAFSGVLTATPLILFSYAARRISFSSLGLIQYVNPTGQFLCAVLVFGEPFTQWHAIAFVLIWIGLIIYSASSIRLERSVQRSAKMAKAPAVSSTTEI